MNLTFFVTFFGFLYSVQCQYSPCIGVSKLTVPCKEYIGQTLEDPSLYYFGNAYITELGCNYQDAINFGSFVSSRKGKCANQRPANKSGLYLTVGSRISLDNDYKSVDHIGHLEGVLGVQFISTAPYVYHGCNTTAQLGTSTIINVYPGGPPVPAVLARDPPKISFPSCTTNDLCTIIFYDAGHLVTHNIWTNWPKENPNLSNFVHPGHGGMYPNPYVFLVLRQSGEIQPPIKSDVPIGGLNLQELMQQNNLKALIGVNWINIVTDISAQESLTNYGLGNYCATILENILNDESLHLVGLRFPISFDVWMTVKFDNNGVVSWIDSIQNGIISKDILKTKPQVTLQSDLLLPAAEDFKDSLYSLILVQSPTVPVANTAEFLVLWFVADIPSGNVGNGLEIVPYKGSETNPYLTNQFYFLLFKQTKSLEKGNVDKVCSTNILNRGTGDQKNSPCIVQLSRLVSDNSLTLSSLARFRTNIFA